MVQSRDSLTSFTYRAPAHTPDRTLRQQRRSPDVRPNCFAPPPYSEHRDISTRALVLNDRSVPECATAYLAPRASVRVFSGDKVGFVLASVSEAMHSDVVLFTHVHLSPIARALRLVRGRAKRCLVVHGVDVWRPLPARLHAGVGSMDHVLSVSRYTLDAMQKANGSLGHLRRSFPARSTSSRAVSSLLPKALTSRGAGFCSRSLGSP